MPYKDPEKDKAVKKAWYLAHKDQQHARQKSQRAADPEKRRTYEKIYYQSHQQHVSSIHKRYYAKNRDRLLAKARELDNAKRRVQGIPPRLILPPEERPARRKEYRSTYRSLKAQAPLNDLTHAQWLEIQVAQGHRCHYCGKRAKGHLTQDHQSVRDAPTRPLRLVGEGKHVAANERQFLMGAAHISLHRVQNTRYTSFEHRHSLGSQQLSLFDNV